MEPDALAIVVVVAVALVALVAVGALVAVIAVVVVVPVVAMVAVVTVVGVEVVDCLRCRRLAAWFNDKQNNYKHFVNVKTSDVACEGAGIFSIINFTTILFNLIRCCNCTLCLQNSLHEDPHP